MHRGAPDALFSRRPMGRDPSRGLARSASVCHGNSERNRIVHRPRHARSAGRHLSRPGGPPRSQDQGSAPPADTLRHPRRAAQRRPETPDPPSAGRWRIAQCRGHDRSRARGRSRAENCRFRPAHGRAPDFANSLWKRSPHLIELDRELEALLERHPDAALIRSLPGMGVVPTAELIAEAGNLSRFRSADALACATGMAPLLRQCPAKHAS